MQKKLVSYRFIGARPGEEVDGNIYLTNERILFNPVGLGEDLIIELNNISSVGKVLTSLKIKDKSGEIFIFKMFGAKKWVKAVEKELEQ